MPSKHIVVIGTSAGGIEALRVLTAQLPEKFPAPICVVMHTSPQAPGILHQILERSGRLPAINADTAQRLKPGHIYVAPPDCHLVVEPGRVRATKGPRENRFRPAIDPLFRSAAQVYGPGAIGVVLTGNLDDGTAGLWAIKQLGGVAVVQDPADALFSSMPQSAVQHVDVDYCVPLAEIGSLLVELTAATQLETRDVQVPEQLEVEVKIAKEANAVDAGLTGFGEPSSFACPECHGVLLQLKEAGRIRFRCHTGHAYSVDSLLAEIGDATEEALWNAVRALEEGGLFLQMVAEQPHIANDGQAERLRARSQEARRQAEAIKEMVSQREPLTGAAAVKASR